MILSVITDSIVGQLAEIPLKPAVEFMEKYFSDRRSFQHARERLRPKYQGLVEPASYDHVTDNFYLSKQDFVDYFQSSGARSASGLDAFLKDKLTQRAALWQHNRPEENLYRAMIEDFYEAYFSYHLSTDPALCGLRTHGLSQDILGIVSEVQKAVQALQPAQLAPRQDIFADVLLLLRVVNIGYNLIEEAADHIDFTFVDPTSLFPVTSYACVLSGPVTQGHIEALKARVPADGLYTHVVLIAHDIDPTLAVFGRRRGVSLFSTEAFALLVNQSASFRPFVIGSLGAKALAKTLHIDEAYIQPDVVMTTPGDDMELRYFSERINSDAFIDQFLDKPGSGVLIVLGNYGAGKSALAAHTLARLSEDAATTKAAYVPMRDLGSSDDIVAVTRKCASTLRSAYPEHSRFATILDGLDEMPNAMDGIERKRNMQALLQAASLGTKLIVMVRITYFAGLTDFWSFFAGVGESPLWSKLAAHLPGSNRPSLEAVVIRDFDSAQIRRYVASAAPPGGADAYFEQLKLNDLDGTYERLQRNPLYLYLILKTRPWEDESTRCFCDVIEQFINYWLERDVEKGPSRWLLSTLDRKDFIRSIAWDLFQRNQYVMDARSFHTYVARHFALDEQQQDASSLVLDLQTTGIFSVVGNSLTFSLRAYGDFFVASQFAKAFPNPPPARLPDAYQARMWLGLVETRQEYESYSDQQGSIKEWLARMGVPAPSGEPLVFDPRGILCGSALAEASRVINSRGSCQQVREIIRTVLQRAAVGRRSTLAANLADEICDEIKVVLRIDNKLGLHARAAARLTKAALAALGAPKPPLQEVGGHVSEIRIGRMGRWTSAANIMGVMMLAASRGAEVEIVLRHCRQQQAMYFLDLIQAAPEHNIDGIWVTRFGEVF